MIFYFLLLRVKAIFLNFRLFLKSAIALEYYTIFVYGRPEFTAIAWWSMAAARFHLSPAQFFRFSILSASPFKSCFLWATVKSSSVIGRRTLNRFLFSIMTQRPRGEEMPRHCNFPLCLGMARRNWLLCMDNHSILEIVVVKYGCLELKRTFWIVLETF